MMKTSQKVIEVIRDLSGCEIVNETDSLQEDIALDSLGMVTLLVAIEDAFSIELDESDMNPFDLATVSDIIDLVAKYIEVDDE